jgi:hypothetical protein
MNINGKKTAKYFFVLLLGFFVGVGATLLAGKIFFEKMRHNRPMVHNMFVKRLAGDLQLEASQRTMFEKIMQESFTNMASLRKRHMTEFEQEIEKTKNNLKTVLSSNQMEILQNKIERMKRHHKMPPPHDDDRPPDTGMP